MFLLVTGWVKQLLGWWCDDGFVANADAGNATANKRVRRCIDLELLCFADIIISYSTETEGEEGKEVNR